MRSRSLRGSLALAAGLLLLPTVLVAQEGVGARIFSLDAGLIIWTWFLFLLTLGVLAWKVFPWIAGGLEERHAKIQGAIEEARAQREEADRLLREQKEELAEARQQAQRIIEEGREAGERLRKEILEEARQQQEEMLARTRKEMEQERERMIDDLRRETVEISIAAAERVVRGRLDSEENRRLVRDYVSELH